MTVSIYCELVERLMFESGPKPRSSEAPRRFSLFKEAEKRLTVRATSSGRPAASACANSRRAERWSPLSREQSRKLEPGALRSGLLGEQVAQHRNGAGEVAVFLAQRRDPEAGLGAKLRMRILGERLENLLGAGGIALGEQPVGKIEQLRGAGLLAIRLAGAGVGAAGGGCWTVAAKDATALTRANITAFQHISREREVPQRLALVQRRYGCLPTIAPWPLPLLAR